VDESDGLLLRRTVARLPKRQREAVVLRYLLDLSVEATASRGPRRPC
jgi:DNA-directed RNA polymerase specialized sigma24 family protein